LVPKESDVTISLRPRHLKAYKDIALLLWKYGRSDLVKGSGLEGSLAAEDRKDSPRQAAEAEHLTDDLEKLGPTYIKLGQLLSTRPDLIPPAYADALARLQDHIAPFSFADLEKIIADELGVRLSRAFQEIDPMPLATASLGQVHKAILRDGRQVVVKVQRPGIRERMIQDLDVLAEIAEFLDSHTKLGRRADFSSVLEEFRKMLLRELDYRQEAQNLLLLNKNLASFQRIVVPKPVADYSSSRVLTMEYMTGHKIASFSPVVRMEVDGDALAEELFQAYLQQIVVDGFFHADPHPGNVFLTSDRRIALLDLGMAAQLSPEFQDDFLPMVLDLAEGRSEGAIAFTGKHGIKLADYDERELRRRVGQLAACNRDSTLRRMEVGKVMLDIRALALECGMRLPPELSLIGKTLLNLDQIGRILSPDFDPAASLRKNAASLMQKRLCKSLTPGNLLAHALEFKDLVQRLPSRVNSIMDIVANNEVKLTVDAIDEQYLMTAIQKVANRITVGLILAAMIIGAALMMRVETPFRLFGYPGLAIVRFALAAGGGCVLVFQILFRDEATKTKA
jgi:predicted unusual protein kinase regulating ubiquinone biosynthesis (AarF/ABC1/UbiB family)